MPDKDKIKRDIIKQIIEFWQNDNFNFKKAQRNDILRVEIIQRLLGQLMTDDERAESLGLPQGCRIRESAKIISRDKFICGENVWIGEGAVLDASGGLEIGDHTSIGLGVLIWSHSSHLANLTLDNRIGSTLITRKSTKIGRGCFIGGPSVIYSGVTIGERCLIHPMSVITDDIPALSVVAGNPAKVVQKLSDKVIDLMIRMNNNSRTDR